MVCLQALSEEPWSSQPGPTYLDQWAQSFDPNGRGYFWHVTQRRARSWLFPRGYAPRFGAGVKRSGVMSSTIREGGRPLHRFRLTWCPSFPLCPL
eukprot:6494106-Alexandrium_andersonii.AAC.1